METVLDTLVVAVRADTRALERDLGRVRADLAGLSDAGNGAKRQLGSLAGEMDNFGALLATAATSAGRRMENAFIRFARTGRLSFEDLRVVALGVLNDIASAAIRSGLDRIFGGASGGGLLGSFFSAIFGSAPPVLSTAGRAIGGPVVERRPVLVGERGPEVFLPPASGRIAPLSRADPNLAQRRSIAITINVNAAPSARLGRESAGQIALAVRRAVERAERDR